MFLTPFFTPVLVGVVARVTKRLMLLVSRSRACLFVCLFICLFVCPFVCRQPRLKQTQLTALLKDFTGLQTEDEEEDVEFEYYEVDGRFNEILFTVVTFALNCVNKLSIFI